MNVFLTGATGFLGRRLAAALASRGHQLTCAVRRAAGDDVSRGLPGRAVDADFTRMTSPVDWRDLVQGMHVVVNAVGILREHKGATFDVLHVRAPTALFEACAQAGVGRVVQISALGAEAGASTGYHRTKGVAEDRLLALPVDGIVVQPSLIFGSDGASTALFTTLASLPVVPLPGDGRQRIQPIHVDDAVDAIVRLVEGQAVTAPRIALVGPLPTTLRGYLAILREGLHLPRGRELPVPMPLVRLAATIAAKLPGVLLDNDSLAMLQRGNVASVDDTQRLLGRLPRDPAAFIDPREAAGMRVRAQLGWLLPTLRFSVAAVWIVTGIVSLGLYPVDESLALLARVGVTGALAPVALYGAAALDLGLGVATLAMRRRRALWLVQMAVIAGYTLIITVFLPEFWLHPYGPLLKNVPLLATLALLYVLERR